MMTIQTMMMAVLLIVKPLSMVLHAPPMKRDFLHAHPHVAMAKKHPMKFVTMAPLEMVTGAVSLVRLSLASNAPVKWSPHVFQPVAMGFWLRTKPAMSVTMMEAFSCSSRVSAG